MSDFVVWKSIIFFGVRKFSNLKSIQNFDNQFLASDFWIRFRVWDSFQFSAICLPEIDHRFSISRFRKFKFCISFSDFFLSNRILKISFWFQNILFFLFRIQILKGDCRFLFQKILYFNFGFRVYKMEFRKSFFVFDFKKCCISIFDLRFENRFFRNNGDGDDDAAGSAETVGNDGEVDLNRNDAVYWGPRQISNRF